MDGELSTADKCRLLKRAILELPTEQHDYAISVLEEKLELLLKETEVN
jgi:hypothetical protein